MSIISVIISSIITTIVIVWPLLLYWLKSRLEKSIQNEYDKELEKFKVNCQQIVNKSNVSFTIWQNECMKAIKDIFASLSELSLALEHYIPIILPTFNNENDKKEFFKPRYEKLEKVYKEALHTWYPNRIFLEKELNEQIDKILLRCREAVRYQKVILSTDDKLDNIQLRIDHGKPYEYIKEIEEIMNILSDKFKNILQEEHSISIE